MSFNDKGSATWLAKKLIEAQMTETNTNNALVESEPQKVVADSTLNNETLCTGQ